MKVFLGGTVNGSNWREYVMPRLTIDYFNPVVSVWNDEAYELELHEKRHANYCLYVVTPKLTGYFSIAEVVDDAFHKPDQTIFCYLKEDQDFTFNKFELNTLEDLGQAVLKNGGTWLRNLDEVIEFLNQGNKSENFNELNDLKYIDCFISFGRTMSKALSIEVVSHFKKHSFDYWIDDNLTALGPEKIEFINHQIRSAGNFVFIISPQSVKSEICVRELEFAVQNHKAIIVIHHIAPQGNWEKARLILKDYKWYYFDDNALVNILNEINPEIQKNKQHKLLYAELLNKSVLWCIIQSINLNVGNKFRFEIMIMPEDNLNEIQKEEVFFPFIAKYLKNRKFTFTRKAIYTFHSTSVNKWKKNNVFLVGDAAHQMPPFMGQGISY